MKNEVNYQEEYERFADADAKEAELHQRLHGEYDGVYHRDMAGGVYTRQGTGSDARFAFRIIGIVFISVSIIIGIVYFFVIRAMNAKYDRCTESTTAVVIDNVINDDTYTPVFLYEVDGQTYKMRSSYSTNPPKYKLNEKVTLNYNPDDPEEFYVDKASGLVTFVLIFISSIFLLIGLVFAVLAVKVNA